MIDRYLLRYFLAVIDTGNFSKAAVQCNVSQPTLSIGISKLERELGQTVFHRTNRRVELTAAGARFAVHARRIEAEFALAQDAVRDTAPRQTLRLGVLTTIPMRWIEAFVARLGSEPGPRLVEIVEGRERDLIERLARSRIDIALAIVRSDNDRFATEVLFSEGYSLAMPSGHILAKRHVVAAEELADNPMIVRRHCELLSDTSRHFTARGVRPFFSARTFNDDRAIGYVRAGLGVTVMPDCFTAQGVARPKLADFLFERDIGLLYGHHVNRIAVRQGQIVSTLIASLQASRGPH